MTTTVASAPKLYSLSLGSYRAWIVALAFIVGNILLPQLVHLIPGGGLIFLPIYFFTLVGAYKYGVQVGVLTAVASPLINSALFGMPAASMLPIIMIKGVLLAVCAAYAAHRFGKVSMLILACVVLAYQFVGCGIESAITHSLAAGINDLCIGLPGLLLQVVGGWIVLKLLSR